MKAVKGMICLLMALAILAGMSAPANAAETETVTLGKTAPDFEIELIAGTAYALNEDGTEPVTRIFRLSDWRGKVVVINFWATWCPPCRTEMPDMEKLSQEYADDVVFIGIDLGEEAETVLQFIEQSGYTYNFAIDATYALMESYPTDGIPYTVVVDAEGVVSSIRLGLATYEKLKEMLQQALQPVVGE